MDRYVHHKSTGLLGNIGNSIVGSLVGVLFFFVSFPVLWWNEGRTDLSKVAKLSLVAPPDRIDPSLDGKFVSVSAPLAAAAPLEDPLFLNPGPYVSLSRKVETYAWVEKKESHTEKKIGGSSDTVTTYTYDLKWTDDVKQASEFEHPEGHSNPPPRAPSSSFQVQSASVGPYGFTPSAAELPSGDPLPLSPDMIRAGAAGSQIPRIEGDTLYLGGGSSTQPLLGDARIRFQVLRPGANFTLLGQLSGAQVVPYVYEDSDSMLRLFVGTRDQAISTLATEHTVMTWILRGVGFFLMWIGMALFFGPLNAVLDILPFLGKVGRGIVGLVAFPIALSLSGVTILISIVAHNPILLGAVLVVLIVGAIVLAKRRRAS